MSPPQTKSALIVNTWVVEDGRQKEFVDGLISLLEHLRSVEGFEQAQILKGTNPTRFVSMATMRSTQDRQRAIEDHQTRALLRGLQRIARSDHDSYTVLRGFEPRI